MPKTAGPWYETSCTEGADQSRCHNRTSVRLGVFRVERNGSSVKQLKKRPRAKGAHSSTNDIPVGAEIREVRKARGLTLKDLGKLSGRSVAHLSKIERGSTRLSVDLLSDISRALKVDPKWFFPARTGKGPLERIHVVRSQARRQLSSLYTRPFEELRFRDELLSGTLTGSLYMVVSRFPPGERDLSPNRELYSYEGDQHGLVVAGQLELLLGGELIELETGDSVSFPSSIPHRLQNIGKDEAVVVWAMVPVRITW